MNEVIERIDGQQELTNPYQWNVIDEANFKNKVETVFEMVSDALSNTLGPYGATSILEKFGEMHFTKDGWQVLKKIHYADPTLNNIVQLLVNIAAQVVIKVGDGSTSSIMAANSITKEMRSSEALSKLRPKEFLTLMNECVSIVSEAILERSIKIDKESDLNEIYQLAMISTNGDDLVSKIIQEIYKETQNPSIEYSKSKTNQTSYEIIDGYQSSVTYLDPIFATEDDGTCRVKKPLMLMFDHKISFEEHYETIIRPAIGLALDSQRQIVIIAPNYDRLLIDRISNITNSEKRSTGRTTAIYARVPLINNLSANHYNDFVVMTGGKLIKESDMYSYFIDENNEELHIEQVVGEVELLTMNNKATTIQGFIKRNPNEYDIVMRDAKAKFLSLQETHNELGIVNSEMYDLKQRISKLTCKMGKISVGGNSSLEKTANYDLVEDAVKACESAYNYGYNIGGNLIIPIVIGELMTKSVNETQTAMFELLSTAFKNVYKRVLKNKYKNEEVNLDDIISNCITTEMCFDIIKEEYNTIVINPCFTDIEIIKAAVSISSLLISSNQYVSIAVN